MAREKPHINIVFIGHVDHGKSTTVGRLFYDAGKIDEPTLRKLKERATEMKKEGFEFAFFMDNLKEEQERGITIDLRYEKFDTKKYDVTIIDAPGHKDFVKNMITGTSQSDAAVLVVAATDGVNEQTREHVHLARTLGVKQLIILINKMDLVKWDQKKYDEVKKQVSDLLTSVGYKLEGIPFIAAASYFGDNLVKKSANMPWYTGPTLLESFDLLKEPEKLTNLPLRMPVQDVYSITGIGTVIVGKIETGTMKVGQKVVVLPSGKQGEVKSIEMHHQGMQEAVPGDNIGVNIRGVEKADVKRGDMIGDATNPPKIVKEFKGRIAVLEHPTVITKGYTPVFHVGTGQVAGRITAINQKIDPKTGAVSQENPDFIKKGDVAVITVEPLQPLVIEKYSDLPKLATFAMRDMGRTVAAGQCIDLVAK